MNDRLFSRNFFLELIQNKLQNLILFDVVKYQLKSNWHLLCIGLLMMINIFIQYGICIIYFCLFRI
jgi:hypothetical protein